jgi:hypothetical protein
VKIEAKIEEVARAGKTRGRIPWRCLYRGEIQIIVEQAPTLSHVAFFVLNLTTGIRPEVIKLLSPKYYDPADGSLDFANGSMNERLPGGEKKRLSNDQESVVARLILSFPDVFDHEQMPDIVAYFEGGFKKNDDLRKFAKEKKIKLVTHRDFRASCAKNLLQSGFTMEQIALRLGNTEDVASEHYADNYPPDAVGIEPGPAFYGNLTDFKIPAKTGTPVCLKGSYWDGWLLKIFLIECIQRKRQTLGAGSPAFAAFKALLEEKTLAAYNYEQRRADESMKVWGKTHDVTSLDDV